MLVDIPVAAALRSRSQEDRPGSRRRGNPERYSRQGQARVGMAAGMESVAGTCWFLETGFEVDVAGLSLAPGNVGASLFQPSAKIG